MPSVTFIAHDGTSQKVLAEAGQSLMRAAIDNGVSGIIGDCGGACACATCHCYIDEAWAEKMPAAEGIERDMLECVIDPQPTSRLSCQVKLTAELDGLVVSLPASQY